MKQRKKAATISHSENSDSDDNKVEYSNGLLDNHSDSEAESSTHHHKEEIGQKSNTTPKQSSQKHTYDLDDCLQKFKSNHPDLKKFKIADCLSDNDEISIVELPNTIDPNLLLNKQINFQNKTKLKINNVKYVMKPCQDIEEPLLLLTKKKRFVRPMARLKLQEYIREKQKDIQIDSDIGQTTQKHQPLLPETLKSRHPIFGSDYKNKIELDDSIKNRLNHSDTDNVEHTKKGKKKKKKADIKSEKHDEEKEELIFKLLRESITTMNESTKKKKKIKEEVIDNNATDVIMSDSCSDTRKSKKKDKKKNKTEIDDSDINKVEEEKESLIQKLIKDQSLLIGNAEPKKKTKNKSMDMKSEKSIINSTIATTNNNPDFEIDVSRIDPLEKAVNNTAKKKKKIKQEVVENVDVDDDEDTKPPPTKKSKKIEKEMENSLILDILNTVKNELNSPKQKKLKL